MKSRRHALGQHFLKNPRILAKIVATISPEPDDIIIEVGPGEGHLTALLAKKAARVIAIEKDPRLLPELEKLGIPNLTIIPGDVLEIPFSELGEGTRLLVTGNLPYAISSAFLLKVWEEHRLIERGHFLLQKEVAHRICAGPGSKSYAPLSIALQNHFRVKQAFTLGPGAFSPPPKVDSALISLFRRAEPLLDIPDETEFLEFLRRLFHERRKTLRNNLKRLGFEPSRFEDIARDTGFSLQDRPERLTLEQFAALYAEAGEKNPS